MASVSPGFQFFQGMSRVTEAAAEMPAELQVIDLVFILGFRLQGANGPCHTEQSVATGPQFPGGPMASRWSSSPL